MDGVETNNVKKKGPLLVFDFDRTITNLNTDTEVSHPAKTSVFF
jgi:phosphoserine phosphatase